MKLYVIGSLRNEHIPNLGNRLREHTSWDVFDDWYSAGPEADDRWRDYEQSRGHKLQEALAGRAAQHVFHFDKNHLDTSDAVVLVWPAGKSGHLEFGYSVGRGKIGYILIDGEPERYDVMLNFADRVFTDEADLIKELNSFSKPIVKTDSFSTCLPAVWETASPVPTVTFKEFAARGKSKKS